MRKTRNAPKKLGLKWKLMEEGERHLYRGSPDGVKNNVARANKVHKPKKFGWGWDGRRIYVWRIS